MDSLPSPLDGPRLFDDEALSAWYTNGDRFAAPRSEFVDAKAFAYSAARNASRPRPAHEDDAIAVEIVRGANGVHDNEWTVLIDGVRCRRLPPVLQDGDDVYRCVLPPGVPLPSKDAPAEKRRLSTDTRVRPVVFAVRLEEEALAPLKATLYVDQILETSERAAQDKNVPEVTTIQSSEIKPYRVSDFESNVVATQYPFCAPAQSVLGILSLDAFSRWKYEKASSDLWNVIAPVVNVQRELQYATRTRFDVTTLERLTEDGETVAVKDFADSVSRPKDWGLWNTPAPPKPGESRTTRIGGAALSSARELGMLFATLTSSCEEVKEFVYESASFFTTQKAMLRNHVQAMELVLSSNRSTKAVELLRALCSTEVNKEIESLLRPGVIPRGKTADLDDLRFKYDYDENTGQFKRAEAIALESKEIVELTKSLLSEYKNTKADSVTAPYLFTYERLMLPRRILTTVRTRIRVEILDEYSDQPLVFEFVAPSMDDGIVAHAVYSGTPGDISYMDAEAKRFLSCLLEPYVASRDGVPRTPPAALQLSSGTGRRQRTLKATLTAARKQLWKSNSLNLDTASINKRVTELRVFVRQILPTWPPVEDAPRVNADDVAFFERYEQLVADPVPDEAPEEPSTESGGDAEVQISATIDALFSGTSEQEELRQAAIEDEDARILELRDAVEKADEEDSYSVTFTSESMNNLLVRRLPQMVRPSVSLAYSFKIPSSLDPPTLYIPWQTGATSLSWSQTFKVALSSGIPIAAVMYMGVLQASLVAVAAAATPVARIGYIRSFFESMNIVSAARDEVRAQEEQSRAESTAFYKKLEIAGTVFGQLTTLANAAYNSYSYSVQSNKNLLVVYQEHAKKERGVPVRDAFAAANEAVSAWARHEKKRVASMGALKDASVTYNPTSTRRLYFVEYFRRGESLPRQRRSLRVSQDWEKAPDSNSMLVLPPPDVHEAFFEAQELRAIPIARAVSFATGAAGSGPLVKLVGTAANATFRDLARRVVSFLRLSCDGHRLEHSPASMALEIVEQGAALLRAVYGGAAGVTLVAPDDVIWSCVPAGSFARLALRHLSLYDSSPTRKRGDFVKQSLAFWQVRRRQLVDRFSESLLLEARRYAKSDYASEFMSITRDLRAEERGQALARVNALVSSKSIKESEAVEAAVRSSFVDGSFEDFQGAVIKHHGMKFEVLSTTNDEAVWASRRMNAKLSRSLEIGDGTGAVVDALSSMSVATEDYAVFYCPIGSRLSALPGSDPFLVHGINERLVWMEPLRDAASQLLSALRPFDTPADGWRIDATPIGTDNRLSGLARHPTTVVLRNREVCVGLSKHASMSSHGPVSAKVASMRRRSFNSDRLFFALSLAYSHVQGSSLCVALPDEEVDSLAIALALRRVEGGERDTVLQVNVRSPDSVRNALVAVIEQSNAAMARGCTVSLLSEVALCM